MRSVSLALVVVLAWCSLARADDRPWAAGISEDEQNVALEIYTRGNTEFASLRFQQALELYREALAHWDHPAIRFNMVVCLINLDQPLAAHENLEKAMAFGAAAIGGEDHYAQGLTFQKLLDARLSRVHIACREPGAKISLDGKLVFTGPGAVDRVLMPGDHQIVATKTGYITQSESLTLVAGKLATHDVRLIAFKEAPHVERRWSPWKPWLVIGAGVAVAGIGGLVFAAAASNLDDYDAGIAERCPRGCTAEQAPALADIRAHRTRADAEQVVAVTAWVLGGAAVITGAIGVLVNQPRTVESAPRGTPIVAPVPGGATLAWSWSF